MKRQDRKSGAMHLVTNRRPGAGREYVTHLLRRSYREGGKVKKETIANLTRVPEPILDGLRSMLAGKELVDIDSLVVESSTPHGHVEAILAMMRRLKIAALLDKQPAPQRDLVLAMIAQRILSPGSKLFTTRVLNQSTLAEELKIGSPSADDLYGALDWLIERQPAIEQALAKRHLQDGGIALYDLSSSYFEGRNCPLAMHGYSRDKRRGSLQIVYGLLCDQDGRPVAIEAYQGNTIDSQTVQSQITKMKDRFALDRAVLVSDRGMVTHANLAALSAANLDWITALKAPQVQKLAAAGVLPLSLFEQQNLAQITTDDFPNERLVICRNPLVAEERRRKREELLVATEAELAPISVRVAAGTLQGSAEIGLAVGAVINKFKMKKHMALDIKDRQFAFSRKTEPIAREAELDGIYILRTSLSDEACSAGRVVRSYKQLSRVERAFRTLKGDDLEIRPIFHNLEKRVRAHIFLVMLAYYVQWHLREAWAPLLFKDEHPPQTNDPVGKAVPSEGAKRKASQQITTDGVVVHSFKSLLTELATRARTTIRIGDTAATFTRLVKPTEIVQRALELVAQLPVAA
jgi:Transposase DDE domain